MFIIMKTFILTDCKNFRAEEIFSKTIKENYAFALENGYIFTEKNVKHRIKHDADSA